MASNVTPFLWFDENAEDAAIYYTKVFKNAKILGLMRYGDTHPSDKGKVMTVRFEVEGQEFIGLNGGPHYKMNMAVSFLINAPTQDEVDRLWELLKDGGETHQCGWVTDKFGVTWQVVPDGFMDLIGGDDEDKSARAMEAMMKMVKLDINELRRAYDGKT
jgi:predicted 3-demethylubiquinone-9 3-methyltransferase (glyoxalase superfamily)